MVTKEEFFHNLKNVDAKIIKIHDEAIKNHIPIITKETLDYIKSLIIINDLKSVLEIGTATGYSAINIARIKENIVIDTFEIDESRFNIANDLIQEFNLESRINTHLEDVLINPPTKKYDLIFIDGAKSKNQKFFEKLIPNLNKNGFIVVDNIYLNSVQTIEILSKRKKTLLRKHYEFLEYLKSNQDFTTIFLEIGDGIAVSWRNK